MLQRVIRQWGKRTGANIRVVWSDGTNYQTRAGKPEISLTLRSRAAAWRVALFGHIGLLECYFRGEIDIEGDLGIAFRTAMGGGVNTRQTLLVRARNAWHELRYSNRSAAQAKSNARFHYGLGTEFYRPWLDHPYLMYTCAYWKEGTHTLEEAQQNKMEHVCRKIRLQPGETVLDLGCGWGGFSFYAAERHRAQVTGLNTTTEQVAEMRAEIERRGLQGRVTAVEADFREVPGPFDKCVSIGVLEHAGRDQLAEVVRAHADCLKPGGLGMLHFIGHVGRYRTEFFIRRYVFPGGWIPSLADTIVEMERAGLEILDIENLRRHYALTLDCWSERFDANWERIHGLDPARFNESFRRIWRTYLYGSAEMFRSSHCYTHLFQITYSKGSVGTNFPMSRAHLYA